MNKLFVEDEIFKKIKKHKKVIYLKQADDSIKDLKNKSKVVVINNETNKTIKRKIKKVHSAANIEELKKLLNKKEKYIYQNDIQDNDNKVVGIEFKHKRKIFRKIILIFIVLLIMFGLYMSIKDMLENHKVNKLKNDIEEIKEEITYVMIEINPKIVLELKNSKVIKSGCLNDDCKVMIDEANITNKSLSETIEILYNKAREKGFDITNGVTVSSVNKKIENEIKNLNYVQYKQINDEEEKEYLLQSDNNEIKEQSSKNENNNKLLEVYKKDQDYGKYYTCNIEANELGCYITSELEAILSKKTADLNEFYEIISYARKFEKILDRFNIRYGSTGIEGLNQSIIDNIYIKDVNYDLFSGTCHAVTSVSIDGPSETKETCYDTIGITIEKSNDMEPYRVVVLPMSKFNLVTQNYNKSDLDLLITDENTSELIITKYNQ